MQSFLTLLLSILLITGVAGTGWIVMNLGSNVKVVYKDPGNGPIVK